MWIIFILPWDSSIKCLINMFIFILAGFLGTMACFFLRAAKAVMASRWRVAKPKLSPFCMDNRVEKARAACQGPRQHWLFYGPGWAA